MGGDVAVYLHGVGDEEDLWYRIVLEKTWSKHRKKLDCIAAVRWEEYGAEGSWDVIDEEIYWVGALTLDSASGEPRISSDLVKHTPSRRDIRDWETVSSSMKIPRVSPLFAAVGGKKLFVVAGDENGWGPEDDHDSPLRHDWAKCGEVYDLGTGNWDYIDVDIEEFTDYDISQAALVKAKDGEPTGFAFFCLPLASVAFLSFHRPQDFLRLNNCFDGWTHLPKHGPNDSFPLVQAYYRAAPVVYDNTFYWITHDMYLYGYDIDLRCWSVSPSLQDRLPSTRSCTTFPFFVDPILVALGHGKFLVIVAEQVPGHFTMASLAVHKKNNCHLSVTFESLQAFHIDNALFNCFDAKGFDAKAIMLKNTGSGTTRG